MTTKSIKDCEVITVDICDEPISMIKDKKEFVIRDLDGKLIYPNDFPADLRGASFQLMKNQTKKEA